MNSAKRRLSMIRWVGCPSASSSPIRAETVSELPRPPISGAPSADRTAPDRSSLTPAKAVFKQCCKISRRDCRAWSKLHSERSSRTDARQKPTPASPEPESAKCLNLARVHDTGHPNQSHPPHSVKTRPSRNEKEQPQRIVNEAKILHFPFPAQSPDPENGQRTESWLNAGVGVGLRCWRYA